MRIRLAAAFAVILFFVLAGVGVSTAYWSTRDTATGNVQAVSLAANCQPASRLTNGSFETRDFGTGQSITQAVPSDMAPWTTTDTSIEVWSNGVGGVPVQVGKQFVELNANDFGTLYQDVTTTPGQTIRWSLLHRGRVGSDTMRVELGNAVTGVMVSQGTQTDGTAAWGRHEGVYTVPAGQTKTRFAMVAVSTASGNISVGNFIDDVSFGSGPCLKVASSVANVTSGSTLATTKFGDTLRYTATVTNPGGSLALASALATTLPAGLTYVPGTMVVQGTAQSDSAGNDRAEVNGSTLTARMGLGATATVGGSVAPDDSLTFVFDAVVQPSAAGGSVSLDFSGTYADALAPSWTQSVAALTLTTNVASASDFSVVNLATPTPLAGSTTPSVWSFTVKNNGSAAATASSVTVTLPTTLTNATVVRATNTSGSATTACTPATGTTRTCAVGALAVNDTRAITVSGTVAAATANGTQLSVVATLASSTPADPVSSNNSATNTATVTRDTTAPNPATISGTATTTGANLTWPASTDNTGGSGVASYEVYRGTTLLGTVNANGTTALSYSDTTAKSGTTYTYTVVTVDVASNKSAASNSLKLTTLIGTASYYRISSALTATYCIDVVSMTDGSGLEMDQCSATSTMQRWRFNANGTVNPEYYPNASWQVANATATNQFVTVNVASTSTRAQWTVTPATGTNVPDNAYNIKNVATGFCLDVVDGSAADGARLQQFSCNGTNAQRFIFTNMSQ